MHNQQNITDVATITTNDTDAEFIPGTGIFSSYTRGLMWQASSKSVDLHLETIYGQLCDDPSSPYQRLIQRDLTRTFPNIEMFKQENGPGQMAMYRILVAYSLYDAQVGYCQGLAFLVGPLLMNMPEPQAFCVFVRMMKAYELRSMYTLKMDGLHLRLYQFSCLLKENLPKIALHLDTHAVYPAMYASQWFLTLYAYVFPMDLVTHIYDMLFIEGATETLMRVAIAMLQKSEHLILRENEFEDLLDCVATRKLCTPYGDDWTDVINDAMALSTKITRQKLERLEHCYEQEGKQETHQREEMLSNNRLGKFWRRRTGSKKPTKSTTSTSCYNSIAGDEHGPHTVYTNDTISLSSPTNTCNVTSSPLETGPVTIAIFAATSPNQQLIDALAQLQKEHNRTIDELREVRMDKQDVENERNALKMTMMELERRQYQSSPTTKHPVSDSTLSNAFDENDDQQCYAPYDGKTLIDCSKSPSKVISCSKSNVASISGRHKKSLSLSSSASTLINFTPTGAPPAYSMKKSSAAENACVFSTTTAIPQSIPPWSVPYDTQQPYHHHTHIVNSHYRSYSLESDTDDNSDLVSDTLDEWDTLRTELVRAKVAHFESQQQCERLEQEIVDYQSRLDMANEGQMALMDKLVRITSEMDDVLQDKQRYDEKWFDLVQENSRLTVQLEHQQQHRKQEPTPLSANYLQAKIYHLETSLAAAKEQLAKLELLPDHQHSGHLSTSKTHDRLENGSCQQHEAITSTKRLCFYNDETGNDPLIDARTVGNGRIGRSVTLYGRMWHAISPRSQTIESS